MLKRRLSLTALFLIVTLFSLFSTMGSLEERISVSDKYSLYHCNDFDEDGDVCAPDPRDITPVSSTDFPICDANDNYNFQKNRFPTTNGCWFAAAGTVGDEDAVWAQLKEQTIFVPWDKDPSSQDQLGEDLRWISSNHIISESYYDEDRAPEVKDDADLEVTCFFPTDDTLVGDYELHLTTSGAVMCAADHMWQECNAGNIGKITWASNNLERFGVCYTPYYGEVPYSCASDPTDGRDEAYDFLYECQHVGDLYYEWIPKGRDEDHDSYISPSSYHRFYCEQNPDSPMCTGIDQDIDCKDNPLDASLTPLADCPTIENINDCSQLKYSQCPICINPGAAEVCGDGINNDCRGDDNADGAATFSTADDLEGKTPDDCDHFKEGCEQKTFENVADSQTEEGEEQTPVQHRNVDDGYYSWIDTLEGG
ncbi:MAG TPA: hypothetical protein VJI15_04345, partial [Candidatus Nanoarchaeia archaeon]|nr:hypothetical protein [Candidatus Nanoarchaeia archaeon]